MKVNEVVNKVKVEGLEESIEWTVSESSFIFDLLSTKLYKNPHLAITRELATNGSDANIESGNEKLPLEINLPTQSIPFLVIKDNGIGIGPERAKELYTRLGESTKRNSNKTVGAYGIGRVSAFALTDQFTVETAFEGRKYIYLVFKNTRNIPELSSDNYNGEPTTEPSGTKITVPIKRNDVNLVQAEGLRLFRFFKVQPICNIQLPVYTPLFEAPSYTLDKNSSYSRSNYAVMGSIVYPLDSSITKCVIDGYSIFLHFKIGELSIETSRDGLVYDGKTKAKLDEAFKSFRVDIKERLLKDTEGLKDWALWCKRNELNSKFRYLIECESIISLQTVGDIEEINYDFRKINLKPKEYTIEPFYSTAIFIKDKESRFLKPMAEWKSANSKSTVYLLPNDALVINKFKDLTGLTDKDLLFTSMFKHATPVSRTYNGIRGTTLLKSGGSKADCFETINAIPTIKYYVIRKGFDILYKDRIYSPINVIRNLELHYNSVSIIYKGEPVYAVLPQYVKKLPKTAIDVVTEILTIQEGKLNDVALETIVKYQDIDACGIMKLSIWNIKELKEAYNTALSCRNEAHTFLDIRRKLSSFSIFKELPTIVKTELKHESILKRCTLLKYLRMPADKADKKYLESLIQKELEAIL